MKRNTIIIFLFAAAFATIIIIKEYTENRSKPEPETGNILPGSDNLNLTEPRPEKGAENLIVKASGAVTFLLSEKNEVYYYKGAFDGRLTKTDYKEVRQIIKKLKSEIIPADLMFIIKSGKGASFKNAIDILDEMVINTIPAGHYAELEITKEEIESINILKKAKNG